MEQLKDELNQPFDDLPLSNFCTRDGNGVVHINRFKTAEPLNKIKNQFYVISREYTNDFFHKFWSDEKSKKKDDRLDFTDVVQIWQKSLKSCNDLIDGLQCRKISLSKIKELIEKREMENLICDLKNLDFAISQSKSIKQSWIGDCVHQVYQWYRHGSTALAFLELKKQLELTGDFSRVERIANEVCEHVIRGVHNYNHHLVISIFI